MSDFPDVKLYQVQVQVASWPAMTLTFTPVFQILKTSLLTARTTSLRLPQALLTTSRTGGGSSNGAQTNHTIFVLALVLLHELRLRDESPFWGYLQSLPREVDLPLFWGCSPNGIDDENDEKEGLKWLEGTEAARDLARKEREGMGLVGTIRCPRQKPDEKWQLFDNKASLEQFYSNTSHLLPPTLAHPLPSPLSAFHHTYSLITTRSFLIDLYHILALVPFADILNHSSRPHTSLASDDFVCHICGSLPSCSHDIPSSSGVVRRLEHLSHGIRKRIESESDCVEMRLERSVAAAGEVFNSYGEGIGDARLLVEWGFVEGEFAGDGITWEVDEVLQPLQRDVRDEVRAIWEEVIARNLVAEEVHAWGTSHSPPDLETISDGETSDGSLADEDEHARLIDPSPLAGKPHLLNLSQNAQVSLSLWSLILLNSPTFLPPPSASTTTSTKRIEEVEGQIIHSVRELETAWERVQGILGPDSDSDQAASVSVSSATATTITRIQRLLEDRLAGMYQPDLDMGALFEIKDVSQVQCRSLFHIQAAIQSFIGGIWTGAKLTILAGTRAVEVQAEHGGDGIDQ